MYNNTTHLIYSVPKLSTQGVRMRCPWYHYIIVVESAKKKTGGARNVMQFSHTQTLNKPGYQRAKEKRDKVYIVFGDDENHNSIVGDRERFIIIIIIIIISVAPIQQFAYMPICLYFIIHIAYMQIRSDIDCVNYIHVHVVAFI